MSASHPRSVLIHTNLLSMFVREEGRVPVTYFACTLGEAQQINNHKVHFRSVSHLIEKKADESPNDFAAGFATPRDGAAWTSDVFSKTTTNDVKIAVC